MARILIVDDEEVIRGLLKTTLCDHGIHVCDVAASAKEAVELVARSLEGGADGYDLIISDIRMPGMDGLEFLRLIMHQVEATTPCIVLTGSGEVESAIRAIQVRAYDFLRKPWDMYELKRAVVRGLERRQDLLLRRRYQADLERGVAQAKAELKAHYDATIAGFASLLEDKDTTTADHCERVRRYCEAVGREMGLDGEPLQALELGAMLHDIGKFKIPDRILNKPEKLDPEEWKVMRTHPTIGGDICDRITFLKGASDVVRNHHEKWDGSGYPRGLKGEAIPLSARIFMVVDAFDVITTDRPYKVAQPPEEAIAEIRRCAGAHFDPAVVEVFDRLYPAIKDMMLASTSGRRSVAPAPSSLPTPRVTPPVAVPAPVGHSVRSA